MIISPLRLVKFSTACALLTVLVLQTQPAVAAPGRPPTTCPAATRPPTIVDDPLTFPAWGTKLAEVDGIPVCSNGKDFQNWFDTESGLEYQCVQFVQWYFAQKWGIRTRWGVRFAYEMAHTNKVPAGVQLYPNGSSPGPMRGDALVFEQTEDFPGGHVALVTDVADGKVFLAEQNYQIRLQASWGQDWLEIDSNNVITTRGRPPVAGWLHAEANTGLKPGPAILTVDLALPGISNHPSDNGEPLHPVREVTVELYDAAIRLVFEGKGIAAYDPALGVFRGKFSLGNLASGLYQIRIRMDHSLKATLPGPYAGDLNVIGRGVSTYLHVGMQRQGVTTGGELVWGFPMNTADVDGNNRLDRDDQLVLLACVQGKGCPVDSGAYAASDINDDGRVDVVDEQIWQQLIEPSRAGD